MTQIGELENNTSFHSQSVYSNKANFRGNYVLHPYYTSHYCLMCVSVSRFIQTGAVIKLVLTL